MRVGFGLVEHDSSDVDWDGITWPLAYSSRARNMVRGTAAAFGREGQVCHGLDQVGGGPPLQGDPLCYWGVACNRIRMVGIHRQYKIRVCQECGEMLRTYEGADDQGNADSMYRLDDM